MKAAALTLLPGEGVGPGLVRLGRAVASSVAPSGTARSPRDLARLVHRQRLAIKWLRSMVQLIRPVTGKPFSRRVHQRLRAAARMLAGFRDDTVMRQAAGRLSKEGIRPHVVRALQTVESALRGSKADPAHTADRIVAATREVEQSIRVTVACLARCRLGRDRWEAIESGLRSGYRRARKGFRRAEVRAGASDFHEWRKRIKVLVYQLGLIRGAWPGRLAPLLRDLDELQRRLGEDHDLDLLRAMLEGDSATWGGRAAVRRVVRLIEKRSRRLRRRCLRRGHRVLAEPTSHFLHAIERHFMTSGV